MEIKYYIIEGKAKERYLELEGKEFGEKERIRKAMYDDRNDIEHYRLGRTGTIAAIKFKNDKTPEGVPFVRAHKQLPRDEVRPHGKDKKAKEWRNMLKDLAVKTHCQDEFRNEFKLTTWVTGGPHSSGRGHVCKDSRIAHIGPEVVAEVPTNEAAKFEPTDDFKEIKKWEFEKLKEDNKDFDYDSITGFVFEGCRTA